MTLNLQCTYICMVQNLPLHMYICCSLCVVCLGKFLQHVTQRRVVLQCSVTKWGVIAVRLKEKRLFTCSLLSTLVAEKGSATNKRHPQLISKHCLSRNIWRYFDKFKSVKGVSVYLTCEQCFWKSSLIGGSKYPFQSEVMSTFGIPIVCLLL